jgi:hypothetical protein
MTSLDSISFIHIHEMYRLLRNETLVVNLSNKTSERIRQFDYRAKLWAFSSAKRRHVIPSHTAGGLLLSNYELFMSVQSVYNNLLQRLA